MSARFSRVLIANRGEIALRVARTLHEMGIMPVAVYSDADRIAPHVRACELAYHLGPPPAAESYLRIDKVIEVCKAARVDAVHPGYGFLSENPRFAEALAAEGIVLIGPPASAMRAMGSKTAARERMIAAGVPVVPGSPFLADEAQAIREAARIGYPVMLKASAGGGGKGMRAVHREEDLAGAMRAARSEAQNAFGDPSVYLEKVIEEPHHVEIQILSGPDSKTIWLGERECSMQRRHQKVIEETPSPILDEKTRQAMGEVACRAAEAVSYVGAGTIEFLVDAKRNFYFLEMNTRLQVEHPVTEMCCGVDLVEAQVRVAQGEPLPWRQDQIVRRGHSMEVRLYAEDPERNFLPSPGLIEDLVLPDGPGVRVDCGVAAGFEVPRFYDPMMAKIVTWAEDRERARRRMDRALGETVVKGLRTNTQFLRRLLAHPDFVKGIYHTGTIAQAMQESMPGLPSELLDVAVAAMVVHTFRRDQRAAQRAGQVEGGRPSTWRTPVWRLRNG